MWKASPCRSSTLRFIPRSGTGDGLTGEYFNSADLSGKPVLTRIDRNINFNWDKVVPVDGLQRNNYSVRWTGTFTPPAPGDYQLGVRVNYCYACENAEGFRLYLDDKLIVESSGKTTAERGAGASKPPSTSPTPSPTPIRLEYLHGTGTAGIDLTWHAPAEVLRERRLSQAAKQSDVTIAFVGLSPSLEGEEMPVKLEGFSGGDRTSIDLPAVQEELLKALAATGKPLVVVCRTAAHSRSTGRSNTPTRFSKHGIPAKKAAQLSPILSPATTIPLDVCRSPSTHRSSRCPPSMTIP